jgi:hypothetical protein
VHHRVDVGPCPEDLGVDGQLVRHRPAGEVAGHGDAVEVHLPDVLGQRQEEPALPRPPAADEQPVGSGAEADVPEHVLGQAAGGQDPAGVRDEQPPLGGLLVHWYDPSG